MKEYDGLSFVIMIAIHKVSDETRFRKNMFKAKRKPVEETWSGPVIEEDTEIARFAPSACNSQPWFVRNEGDTLTVYRYKKPGKRGIMPAAAVSYYNRIDIGIYLCFLELLLEREKIEHSSTLYIDDDDDQKEYSKVAEYLLS